MKWIIYEVKWSNDPRSYERNFSNCVEKAEKIQDFNGVWTRDLAMPVRRFNQLGYEGTGSAGLSRDSVSLSLSVKYPFVTWGIPFVCILLLRYTVLMFLWFFMRTFRDAFWS